MENLVDRIKYKSLINKKGVYIISCNQYQYIGSSKNIYVRLKEHHNSLKINKHYNVMLQRLYNKYGVGLFKYSVLEFCDNYIERETYYIKILNPIINVDRNPQDNTKSQSTKDKIGKANKGKLAGSKNPAAKKIYQYDFDGNYIKEFLCATDAGFELDSNSDAISMAAGQRIKSSAGYMWRFTKSEKITPYIKRLDKPTKHNTIQQINNKNEIVVWPSIIKLANHLKVSIQSIHQAIKKNTPCKGFKIHLN